MRLPRPRLIIVSVIILLLFVTLGIWGIQVYRQGMRVSRSVFIAQGTTGSAINGLQWWWKPASLLIQKLPASSTGFLADQINSLKALDEVIVHLQTLLGSQSSRHYAVLFQNNMELRPTGGFLGSYAEIWMNQGKMSDIKIQDIYVPDGQIKGYVKEPEPIKKYLFNEEHPGWRLRDSNWSPDFPEAVKAINWFFKEGEIATMDGMIAINLYPITDILRVTGPIILPDYENLEITADTFYQEAQRHAEENFFPGSTQKSNFLSSVGKQLLFTITSHPDVIPRLIPVIMSHLQQKHISVFIPDALENGWQQLGWDGRLREFVSDYLMVVEANVGMSKANCCVDRTLTDDIRVDSAAIGHHISLQYVNHNPVTPQPPISWGGGYKNYLRFIIPSTASVSAVMVNNLSIPTDDIDEELIGDKKSVGFLVLTEGGQQSQVQLWYTLPFKQQSYSLLFQKQSGISGWPMTITVTQNGVSRIYKEKFVQRDRYFY